MKKQVGMYNFGIHEEHLCIHYNQYESFEAIFLVQK